MKKKARKRNKLSIRTTTWMDLKIIALDERSQAEKDAYCMI